MKGSHAPKMTPENNTEKAGTPFAFVIAILLRHLSKKVPLGFNPFVKQYKDLEATYNAVFAELRTMMTKQAFRNPGSSGILEFSATIIAIEAALAF